MSVASPTFYGEEPYIFKIAWRCFKNLCIDPAVVHELVERRQGRRWNPLQKLPLSWDAWKLQELAVGTENQIDPGQYEARPVSGFRCRWALRPFEDLAPLVVLDGAVW